MYPCVHIHLPKLAENTEYLSRLCRKYGIEIMAVTKVFCGDPLIARVLVEHGIHKLGDSRLENIKKYQTLNCEKWLIRAPGLSEVEDTIRYCDVSLNSEPETLRALEHAADEAGKVHKVVLMVDLGDLREGCIEEEDLRKCVEIVKQSKHLMLYGLGTNLTCFSFVQPDSEKMKKLARLAEKYDAKTCVSGGNSATIHLMQMGEIPSTINSLRLGECLLFGRERAHYQYLAHMHKDAFCVEAEIIECKEKPSMPIGTIGKNSYGSTPEFEDHGIQKRAICALGRQDIDPETMWPVDEKMEILGASSDHLVVNLTQTKKEYHTGDKILFRLGYFATMRAFTSGYITKKYVK